MPVANLDWKKGDTFACQCKYTNAAGEAISLNGITLASQVRTANGSLVSTIAVTVIDQDAGEFSLEADTSSWPLGCLLWDIQYSFNSKVVSTETVKLTILQDVTAS